MIPVNIRDTRMGMAKELIVLAKQFLCIKRLQVCDELTVECETV